MQTPCRIREECLLWSANVSQYEIQFRCHVRRDEVRPLDDGGSDLSDPCVVYETLVLLSDAGLQRDVQLAPTDCLDKQFLGSFLMSATIFIWEMSEGQRQPAGEINVSAELIDLTLGEYDVDLDSALPTPFLDVKDTGGGEWSSLHGLRSDKQGHAELGRPWGMRNCHGAHSSMTAGLSGCLIDGLAARR